MIQCVLTLVARKRPPLSILLNQPAASALQSLVATITSIRQSAPIPVMTDTFSLKRKAAVFVMLIKEV
jgi:hypothetical protein